jgi:formate hydrogenlyase subunit 3/multisubunit Na+/H+ antiporter MnhD subunit
MPAPLLFLITPGLVALVVYGVGKRRWLAVGLAAGSAALLGLLAVVLPLDEPWLGLTLNSRWIVLGRTVALEPVDRLGLAFIFAQAALLFFVSRLIESNRFFLPLGLLVLSLLSAALFIQPFVFAALFLELASALAVFLLADERHRVTRGALRFFVFMTLGMIFILITGWLLEAIEASPDDSALTLRATLTLAVGFAIVLGVAPFHSWLPVVAEYAPAHSTAFVLTVMRFPAVFVLLQFLHTYPWLNQNPAVYRMLTLVGGGMALLGAVFVFGQRNFGRALGYVMMLDIGATLLGMGLSTVAGVESVLAALALRGIALTAWGLALEQLRGATLTSSDDFDSLRGLGRRRPFAAAVAVLSLLSLAGFPLTAGFPGRWALLAQLAQIHPTAALFLLVGIASVGLVCARGLAALITPVTAEAEAPPVSIVQRLLSEDKLAIGVYGFALLVILSLGFFPQWLLPAVANTASFFVPPAP